MRIAKTHILPLLPVPKDRLQDNARPDVPQQAITPQGTQITRAARTIEDIRQAELMLNRQREHSSYTAYAEDSRQQRAVAAYTALQQNDERAYVSEVLGIDVFA
jgi:16S rRNA C1402 (ribose-2'-O) methylase RsmI